MSQCACVRLKKKTVIHEDEEFSDSSKSDIADMAAMPCLKNKPKPRRRLSFKIGDIRRMIPDKILQCFGQDEIEMTKLEKTIKASLLIQKWYRSYMARLEVRRRYTWTIFQTLEYAGEQDQVKLYNFFNALLTHIPQTANRDGYNSKGASRSSSFDNLDLEFEDESPDEEYSYDQEDKKTLRHFTLEYPYTEEKITELIEIFRKHRHFRLPPKVVADILRRSIMALRKLPNINVVSTALSKQITVCGDLHGKFDDLLVILHKNGLPSTENPYVFNGDFVDRGKRGLEVILVLLLCFITFPGGVYLNRGNHEDHIMNQRYGFIREVQSKYRKNHERILKLFESVYRWLPLGTIVNNRVLIVHGGISDTTDLEMIRSLEREKYVSLLRPPLCDSSAPGAEAINKVEWKQVFDILWSDPQETKGCIPNNLRGAGTYFGPDVTKKFLEENRLSYIVRSHECKHEGYEMCHDNLIITIFSASNYYEIGSNNGAYVKLMGPNLEPHFVQYMANAGRRKLNFYQRMGLVETGATKELQAQILNVRDVIEEEFSKLDPDNTGLITVTQWCITLEKCTGLQIPWRLLKEKLVSIDPESKMVQYQTTFDNIKSSKLNSVQGASTVVETLYRNKSSLEAIFRIIDKDNSGYISLDELAEACNLIKEHMPCNMTEDQLQEICRMMDINKDGLVDLNEFLETFRMVDPESRRKNMPNSPDNSNLLGSENRSPRLNKTENTPPKDPKPSTNHTKENGDKNSIFIEAAEHVQDDNSVANGDSLSPNQGEKFSLKVQVHNFSNGEGGDEGDSPVLSGHTNGLKASPVLSSRRGSLI
ncbi:serine/threonine-protein phosphatase rdgC [Anthonomus grandis grandis]|uniref:serine/threonine-protein phosphatase rdgC n=1 Tax=Anthonomus grandis grandis TaxID=2921223 RepID=UPI002166B57A|nr:serine/threonine-protein phosphatase rdgC [Anthonomus grandis grandis]